MILGQTYDEQLFKSDMFRLFINTFADDQNGIINDYKQSCSLSNTISTITVSDGAFLLQGGIIQVQGNESISVDLDNLCCILVFTFLDVPLLLKVILEIIICSLIVNIIFYLFFKNTPEFKKLEDVIRNVKQIIKRFIFN